MAYVGTPIDTTNQFQSLQGKRFSGDASTTAFTLDIAPSSVFDIEVFVENVRQDPNSAYGISGTTLTFTGAPPSGTNNIYVVHQAKAVGTINPTNDSVTASAIADDAVESEHLNNNIISGQTALGAAPADTDEFLVSDAGTIKRVDYSYIKASSEPVFAVVLDASQTLSNNTVTKLTFTSELIDTDSAFADSKFTVPSGKAGKYFFQAKVRAANVSTSLSLFIYKNGSEVNVGYRSTGYSAGNIPYGGVNLIAVLDLSAGDYIEIYGDQNSGGSAAVTTKLFQGYKLA
jgi:hypothetical protein